MHPPPTEASEMAEALIRQNRLTPYQIRCILEGQGDGLVFDEYIIVDKLGEGGMGIVYKAQHRRMKRYVAIKAIAPRVMESPHAKLRFHREVEAAARLDHQNIVRAYDAREVGGNLYLVLEYVKGRDLADLIRLQGPLSCAQGIDFILQAARGLDYSHRMGIIHRDIKPSNLLVDEHGILKILDLGLARIDRLQPENQKSSQRALTATGQIMGTADYMAPEQAANVRNASARSDIYGLGCTLYQLLSGRPPYGGETSVEKFLAHANDPIPSLRDVRSEVPEELDAALQRLLAKRPEDRFQSMQELIELLEDLQNQPVLQTVRNEGYPTRVFSNMETAQSLDSAAESVLAGLAARRMEPSAHSIESANYSIAESETINVGKPKSWGILVGVLCIIAAIVAFTNFNRSGDGQADRPQSNNGQTAIAESERENVEGSPVKLGAFSNASGKLAAEPPNLPLAERVREVKGIWRESGGQIAVEFSNLGPSGEFDRALLPEIVATAGLRRLVFRSARNLLAEDIDSLSAASSLEELVLWSCGLTDGHVKEISRFPNLRLLSLRGNQLTDAALGHLRGSRHLETLDLSLNGGLTPKGLQALFELELLQLVILDYQTYSKDEEGFLAFLQRLNEVPGTTLEVQLSILRQGQSPIRLSPPYPSSIEELRKFCTLDGTPN